MQQEKTRCSDSNYLESPREGSIQNSDTDQSYSFYELENFEESSTSKLRELNKKFEEQELKLQSGQREDCTG